MKLCRKCKESRSLDEFYKNERVKTKSMCIPCTQAYQKNRRLIADPKDRVDSNFKNNLKFNYKLSIEDYVKLKMQQNYACKICLTHEKDLKDSLCVDHDHVSLVVRGLLCKSCNFALGLFKDKPLSLINAARYLLEPRKEE